VDHIVTRPPTPARAILQRHLAAADAPVIAAAALAPTNHAALNTIARCYRGDDLVRHAEARHAVLRVRHGKPTLVGGQVVLPPPRPPSDPELVALAEAIVRKLADHQARTLAEAASRALAAGVEIPVGTGRVLARDTPAGRVVEAKGTDPAGGRVFGVRIIAYGDSKNGRRYPRAVLRAAAPLYEGAKAYDHHRTDEELRSSTIAGLVGHYAGVAATADGLEGDLHLLPSATHAAEALDATLAAQAAGQAPLVGISHDVLATYKPVVVSGRRLQEATAIVKVNSADVVADPAAGGQAVRMVAGLAG
jgi:hypothetical protein